MIHIYSADSMSEYPMQCEILEPNVKRHTPSGGNKRHPEEHDLPIHRRRSLSFVTLQCHG